jgi:hypothetical protein
MASKVAAPRKVIAIYSSLPLHFSTLPAKTSIHLAKNPRFREPVFPAFPLIQVEAVDPARRLRFWIPSRAKPEGVAQTMARGMSPASASGRMCMQIRGRHFISTWMAAAAFCLCASSATAQNSNECLQSCTASSNQCHQKANAEYAQCMKYCSPGPTNSMCTKQCGAKQTGAANACQNAEKTCQDRCSASSGSGSNSGKNTRPGSHGRLLPAD